MSEEIAHQYLAFMKLSGKPFGLQMCVCVLFFSFGVDSICYGWGYSKYYCMSIFRKAILKFTVCIHMHTDKCLYGSIVVCVALLQACCLCVQQAAHSPLFSIQENGSIALHFQTVRVTQIKPRTITCWTLENNM